MQRNPPNAAETETEEQAERGGGLGKIYMLDFTFRKISLKR